MDSTATAAAKVESPFLKGAEEVAAYLRINVSTVRRKWRRHQLPFYRQGKMVLTRKAELEEWLEGVHYPAYGAKKGKGAR